MISIIMPTHNRPPLLDLTIASVLAQDYEDYEFIVVDASPDKYFEEELNNLFTKNLRDFIDKRSKIKIIYPDCNPRFPGAVKMYGAKHAIQDDDMMIFLDHDDALGCGILKHISLAITQYPHTEMITTDYVNLCYNGEFWNSIVSYLGGETYKIITDPLPVGNVLIYFNELNVYKSIHPYKAPIHPQIISKPVIRDKRITFIEDSEIGDDCIWEISTHSLIETRIPIIGYIFIAYTNGSYYTASIEGRTGSPTVSQCEDACKKYSEILDKIGYKKPRNEIFI